MMKLLATVGMLVALCGVASAQTYQYRPNVGGGGTIYGPSGTTQITPNYGGGYTAYGPNGTTSQYVPNYGGGGTLYVTPGVAPPPPSPPPPAVNLQPDLSIYRPFQQRYCVGSSC
jgi:hypothetical protein